MQVVKPVERGAADMWYLILFALIHPRSSFRLRWDMFIMMLLLTVCVVTPFVICFEVDYPPLSVLGTAAPVAYQLHVDFMTVSVILYSQRTVVPLKIPPHAPTHWAWHTFWLPCLWWRGFPWWPLLAHGTLQSIPLMVCMICMILDYSRLLIYGCRAGSAPDVVFSLVFVQCICMQVSGRLWSMQVLLLPCLSVVFLVLLWRGLP